VLGVLEVLPFVTFVPSRFVAFVTFVPSWFVSFVTFVVQ
jgi:hypothetical protein